jgi:simple sugar transport system ATP-binding protein
MIAKGLARLPQDRVGEGVFGDMSITENLLSESYSAKANSSRGWINWREARTTAEKRVAEYDIKCKSPNVSARLLSDTDKQRLILSRTLSSNPKIILANQPTRGLNVAAASFVHDQLLAARRRGAGILLISEDLDEILSLSDRVCVMFQGKLTAPIWRSEVKFADLGLMMSGQKPEAKAEPHAA